MLIKSLRNNIPLGITALRLALVPPLEFLVSNNQHFLGAIVFLVLIVTDYFDGLFARRVGRTSKFGMYFEVTTDFISVVNVFAVFFLKVFALLGFSQ